MEDLTLNPFIESKQSAESDSALIAAVEQGDKKALARIIYKRSSER